MVNLLTVRDGGVTAFLTTNPLSLTSCHTIGMAHNEDMLENDAEALKVRRADLYAFMQEITVAAAMLPQPETYLEAERAVRTIATADRIIQAFDLPKTDAPLVRPTPTSMRKGLRMLADRMMAAAKTIRLPENALTALHALRYARSCDRMLTQLYTPPKPKPAPPQKPRSPEEIRRENEQVRRELWEKFSSHPEAKAIRAARKLSAQLAVEAEKLKQAKPQPENLNAAVDINPETTEPPVAKTPALNPRPEISEGQDENPSGQMPNQHDPP